MLFSKERIAEIENKIGYEFKSKDLLVQAFIRRSYAHESRDNSKICNEQLEFIGDSALSLAVTKTLCDRAVTLSTYRYERNETDNSYKKVDSGYKLFEEAEGAMSLKRIALVQSKTLSDAIDRMEFAPYLLVSTGDEKNGVRNNQSVKEDLFEAIVGAVTVDCEWDLEVIIDVVQKMLDLNELLDTNFGDTTDYVAILDEFVSTRGARGEKVRLQYKSFSEGLKHNYVVCNLSTQHFSKIYYGCASNEERAKQCAAKNMVDFIEKNKRMAQRVLEAVGEPDEERCINQLQELWQKGIIPVPSYTVDNIKDLPDDYFGVGRGVTLRKDCKDDVWVATVSVDGYRSCTCFSPSKITSKKSAAFMMLQKFTDQAEA